VRHLAELHSAHPRPLRVVVAACYSGGFAEIAFEGADETRGASVAPRCGLFAGVWDRQTSGCDPDPDRRKQEGYSLHVFQALGGHDRDGKVLPLSEIDYDRDGAVGWLDAHTRARIASTSIDVPTTTSARFLRQVESKLGPPNPAVTPEDQAVIDRLGARLGLRDETEARDRLDELGDQLDDLDEELVHAEAELDSAARDLSSHLLERWPTLDDPYHAGFAGAIERDALAIRRALEEGPVARAFRDASHRVSKLQDRFFDLEVEESMVERVTRAYETARRASALSRRGGPDWARYRTMLACELVAPSSIIGTDVGKSSS
jgi:hypothetical protein